MVVVVLGWWWRWHALFPLCSPTALLPYPLLFPFPQCFSFAFSFLSSEFSLTFLLETVFVLINYTFCMNRARHQHRHHSYLSCPLGCRHFASPPLTFYPKLASQDMLPALPFYVFFFYTLSFFIG